LIYIIKSKYTEQVIASTYLWTLSERFLKRRNPIKMVTVIISLILQILAVVFISLAIAHPVFVLPGKANDYCFVLDGSGSMNIVQNGSTRFDAGKEYIREMINSAADGSSFTLITTGNTTEVVMKQSEDKKSALRQLASVQPSYVGSDFSNALTEAQNLFDVNPSCKFYVITDKAIETVVNAEHINVAASVSNYALSDAAYAFDINGNVKVSGLAYSYEADATVTVEVFQDGAAQPAGKTTLQLTANEGKEFSITLPSPDGNSLQFSSLRVAIAEKDALAEDNEIILYNVRSDASYSVLIVSDTPFFIQSELEANGNSNLMVVDTENYVEGTTGYGLYIFENFTPAKMPEDGAVWFVNPNSGVDGTSGFSFRERVKLPGPTDMLLSTSTASRVRNLLKGTDKSSRTGIIEYVKCSQFRSFTTLMTCNGDPVVFAGTNSYGNREVVFAFDLHASDFALSYNGRILVHNLLGYTFPMLVEETDFYCGEAVSVNVLANCTGIRIESPSGKAEYLDTGDAVSEYELTEVGEYTITATIGNIQQTAKVYAQLPVAERITNATEANFIISGEPGTAKRDGKYEDLLYAFIILAVIVVADWLVYCYEQYQLR
ncbi:MAG: BatA and WFA domain-containing protein, partial [Clostridia bacterium]|nr:BatA and WFA domain-containing protein [Clostridia bacterium]